MCVVLCSHTVFSQDACFLGWSKWWEPWLLWTPEKYQYSVVDLLMALRARLLWCSCYLSYLLIFSYVYHATRFCLFGCMFLDNMVTVRGSDLVISKFGFSVSLSLCTPCLCRSNAWACTAIWISPGPGKGCNLVWHLSWSSLLCGMGFADCTLSVPFFLCSSVVGSFKISEIFLLWSSLVCLNVWSFP